jgi:predicted nicotinamide N-methyase
MVDKYIQPINVEIVLDEITNKKLALNDLLIFPHGMDGFHVWEAGIALARYTIKNLDLFKDKKVLELGTGCGTVGVKLNI